MSIRINISLPRELLTYPRMTLQPISNRISIKLIGCDADGEIF